MGTGGRQSKAAGRPEGLVFQWGLPRPKNVFGIFSMAGGYRLFLKNSFINAAHSVSRIPVVSCVLG